MAVLGWRLPRRWGKQASLVGCGLLAVVLVFAGKADSSFFDNARAKVSDFIEPTLSRVRDPLFTFQLWTSNITSLFSAYDENLRLRRENAELRRWQNVALSLEQRLSRYEALLNAVSDPALPSVTARVIGESSHAFSKTMILDTGSAHGVEKGQAIVDERGLIGRIFVAGERTSWVILLTDLNSRVPVFIESSRRRGILAGDNTLAPRLELDIGDGPIRAGDRVYSSGDGGLLPPHLPIGVLMADGDGLRVALFATPEAADYVRVLDYRLPAEPVPSLLGGIPAADAPENAPFTVSEADPVPQFETAPNTAVQAARAQVAPIRASETRPLDSERLGPVVEDR